RTHALALVLLVRLAAIRIDAVLLLDALHFERVVRARHVDDPEALLGRRLCGVADVEFRPLAERRVLVDARLEILVALLGLANRRLAVVRPGHETVDGNLLL